MSESTFTLDTVRPNLNIVYVGDWLALYFSYSTLIAFSVGCDTFVSENVWSKTTGAHLNYIDGGSKEAKARRVPNDAFNREAIARIGHMVRPPIDTKG